eukprot:s3195_g6.t1
MPGKTGKNLAKRFRPKGSLQPQVSARRSGLFLRCKLPVHSPLRAQSINADDAKLLTKSLKEAPRAERSNLLLRVRVGSQCISPLYWALRSGAHTAAKTMLEDMLTIRADRDRYYYGVDDIFRLQPDVVQDILLEAPLLATTLMDGLIWRSHKTKDGMRPVIYYLEHLVRDTDETKTFSRALISFVKYDNPKTIMHPILVYVLDILWTHLAKRSFFLDRVLTMISFVVFLLATCFLNQPSLLENPTAETCLAVARILVYSLGFVRLLYWHSSEFFRAYRHQDTEKVFTLKLPRYLMRGPELFSFALMLNMVAMMTVEPLFHCLAAEEKISYTCGAWTDGMSLAYQMFTILGIFLYAIIVADIANISIELCEFKVLCSHAFKQVVLCLGVVTCILLVFAFAISSMTREAALLTGKEFSDMGTTMTTLVQLAVGVMDTGKIHGISGESPYLLTVIVAYMLVVYSFFFNLLVSQLCGVYAALAEDIQGYAMLARGEVILDTLKAIPMKRWNHFIKSLQLDQRVDFEEGDIGLPGGIKTWEPALAHPITQELHQRERKRERREREREKLKRLKLQKSSGFACLDFWGTVATWTSSTTPLLRSSVALAIGAGELVLLRCAAVAAVLICAAEALVRLLISQSVPEVDFFAFVILLGKMNEAPTGGCGTGSDLPDEAIGPTIAGRLYGRAHRVAMSLRVPRPDVSWDTGDAALVRLEVDEVRDPNTNQVIQAHVPSGVQHLTAALRMAFGQQDQDLATGSLEKFFGLTRGRLTLQEYSVEFDARFDEAADRAGLQMNEVAKFFLFFKNSGLSGKQVDDIKLQVGGDYARFAEARSLALRLASNRTENEADQTYWANDYADNADEDAQEHWPDENYYYDEDDDSWWNYDATDEGGEWVQDVEYDVNGYFQNYMDGDYWRWAEYYADENPGSNNEQTNEEYYGGKGKGKNDGCFVCGSKWHRAADCPMKGSKGSTKGHGYKGKSSFGWRWRPFRSKGKGKSKGKFKSGKGKGKGYGKHWYAMTTPPVRRGLNISDGNPDASTTRTSTTRPQEFSISTPPNDEVRMTRSTSSTDPAEEQNPPAINQANKKHLGAFNFAFNFYEAADYFAVRGEKRRGLIIDPGAASGLIGCDTLKDIIENCIQPYGKDKDIIINKNVTSPVSGISGGSDRTLGQVTGFHSLEK